MPLNTAALNVGAAAIRGVLGYASTHTAVPNASGSSEGTGARKAITWSAATAGDFTLASPIAFTGLAASEAVAAIGLWSAATGGTFYGYFVPAGDSTANAAGEYTVTAITVDGNNP